jgi:hypothetical protein
MSITTKATELYTKYRTTGRRLIQAVIVILLILLLWGILKDWIRPNLIKLLGGYTGVEYKQTIDTTSIKFDSIYFKYDSLQIEVAKLNERNNKTNFKYKELLKVKPTNGKYKKKTLDDGIVVYEVDSILPTAYEVVNVVIDTLIEGKITTILNPKDCKIVSQKLDYKPKFPIFITKIITIEKETEKTLLDKPKAKIGVGALVTNTSGYGGLGVYQTPKNLQYQAGYLKIDKTDNIIIGIVKLF